MHKQNRTKLLSLMLNELNDGVKGGIIMLQGVPTIHIDDQGSDIYVITMLLRYRLCCLVGEQFLVPLWREGVGL